MSQYLEQKKHLPYKHKVGAFEFQIHSILQLFQNRSHRNFFAYQSS